MVAGTGFIDFGADYSYGGKECIWANAMGDHRISGIDEQGWYALTDPVDARIVVPGTTEQSVTSYLVVQVGSIATQMEMDVFDVDGNLLETVRTYANPSDSDLLICERPQADIAAFRVYDDLGVESYGVEWVLIDVPGAPVLDVEIDVAPGNDANKVKANSGGFLKVAILSSASFDAATVDAATVTVAGAAVALSAEGVLATVLEDVNADGLADLVVKVAIGDLDLAALQEGFACLSGFTFDRQEIAGCDAITLVTKTKKEKIK